MGNYCRDSPIPCQAHWRSIERRRSSRRGAGATGARALGGGDVELLAAGALVQESHNLLSWKLCRALGLEVALGTDPTTDACHAVHHRKLNSSFQSCQNSLHRERTFRFNVCSSDRGLWKPWNSFQIDPKPRPILRPPFPPRLRRSRSKSTVAPLCRRK